MAEHVILIAGPMGAGKTTAVQSLSEIGVVLTEAVNSERNVVDKPTTTVALDYGEITLGPDNKVRLYGVPGQRRFSFMWGILRERARGMLLLINNDGPAPIESMLELLEEFADLRARGGVVVGISRTDTQPYPRMSDYSNAIRAAFPGELAPVFTVDPRSEAQMRTMLMTLVAAIEVRALTAR